MPALYVVATPIGNLEDISLRALKVLQEVQLIAAEDTRKTRQLLGAYNIKSHLISYHEHNKKARLPYLLNFLEKGNVALVSEAGTPGLSDPGYELILAASQKGIPIVPVPGASVVVTALVVSGLPANQFLYLGFPPRRKGERKRFLQSLAREPRTLVLLESPHRLITTLNDILEVLGDRKVAVCRELTKVHEEIFRGKVSEAREHFVEPRGEFALVIEGFREEAKPELTKEVEENLLILYHRGFKAKEAVACLAEATNLSKRELYRSWLKLTEEQKS